MSVYLCFKCWSSFFLVFYTIVFFSRSSWAGIASCPHNYFLKNESSLFYLYVEAKAISHGLFGFEDACNHWLLFVYTASLNCYILPWLNLATEGSRAYDLFKSLTLDLPGISIHKQNHRTDMMILNVIYFGYGLWLP